MENLNDVKENFEFFDDWEERYRYLIDLGRKLPALDEKYKTDEYIVRGCTSQVWMVPNVTDGVLTFQADSDAHIVRGLIALIMAAYNGQKISDIPNIDIEETFREIGLDQHLSPNRRNGFFSMVERIKALA